MVGKAVGHQPIGMDMSKDRHSRQIGAWEGCRPGWEGCRSPTYRSGHVKG